MKDLKMKMRQYTFYIITNAQQTICVYVTSAFLQNSASTTINVRF